MSDFEFKYNLGDVVEHKYCSIRGKIVQRTYDDNAEDAAPDIKYKIHNRNSNDTFGEFETVTEGLLTDARKPIYPQVYVEFEVNDKVLIPSDHGAMGEIIGHKLVKNSDGYYVLRYRVRTALYSAYFSEKELQHV